jgi:hypothetical protein
MTDLSQCVFCEVGDEVLNIIYTVAMSRVYEPVTFASSLCDKGTDHPCYIASPYVTAGSKSLTRIHFKNPEEIALSWKLCKEQSLKCSWLLPVERYEFLDDSAVPRELSGRDRNYQPVFQAM